LKRIFFGGMYSLSLMALLFSNGILHPPEAEALTASELQNTTENGSAIQVSEPHAGKKDPHTKFRDGSMGSMMDAMMGDNPHASSKKKSPHSKKGMHSPFSAQGMKEGLGLDDAQAKKIKHVISSYRKESIRKNADLKIAQIEFDESVADKGFNISDVEMKAKNREAVATALTMVRVKAMADARDILSAEQFDKFMTMITHRMSRHKGKGKHGMSGGGHGMKSGHGGKSSHGSFKHSSSAKNHHGGGTSHGKSGGSPHNYED
ncbi:MAG: hypothetical protein VST69_05765, partial [Nitrospirota bacterium]|nr:hypothetical protein [Nitrospirota bacterium]